MKIFQNFQNIMSYQLQQIIRKIKIIYLNDKNNPGIITLSSSLKKKNLPYFLQHLMSLCQSTTIIFRKDNKWVT